MNWKDFVFGVAVGAIGWTIIAIWLVAQFPETFK